VSETLFDLEPAFVKRDKQYGHITVAANPFGQCDGAFVDLGTRLHWWAHLPLQLDSTGARLLAEHLSTWAARVEATTPAEADQSAP
jgi:hypothetical protein